jgi:peptidoglycan/xylan/chitin deacetylase (PgdA/CDA1 family)
MRVRGLLYHDVVPENEFVQSGFRSPDANAYKLFVGEFAEHLEQIGKRTQGRAVRVSDALAGRAGERDFLLTFDDGGKSALTNIADALEQRGWIGHFFVASDYIGVEGFLDGREIGELARRGHIIGSHSCSHPLVMSRCSREQLLQEWKESVRILTGITGSPVTTASIPGGSYSKMVAETAAESGINVLFTSEPTTSVWQVAGCCMVGRFSVQRGTSAALASALAAAEFMPTFRQAAYWNFKKILKSVGGEYWMAFRKRVLAQRFIDSNPHS